MAQTTQGRAAAGSAAKTPDAIALLKQDHRTVEDLFEEFEAAEEDEGLPIAQRICQMLTIHAQIEEEILYPAAREALEDAGEEGELVAEALVEHASAKDLIAKIEAMEEQDETYNATVKVLSEYIKHHVKEEESELFPALKKTELDLKQIGAELFERKQALMTEMGVEMTEEEEAASRSRSGRGRSKRTTRSKH